MVRKNTLNRIGESMKIEEAKKILNENGYVLLDEVFGFSAEEKQEKLKKNIVNELSRFKISLDKDILLKEQNGVYIIYAKVGAYKDQEFDNGINAKVYYYVKSNYVKPANPDEVRKEWQKIEIKNTPASAIAALIQHITTQYIKRKEEKDKENEERRKANRAADEEHYEELRRVGELKAGRETGNKYGDYHHHF